MSIILDKVVSIARLQKDADNANKESYVLNEALQAVKMNIQPASPEETAISDGVFAQTYLAFTTYSGICVGDKVTVSGTGDVYRVKGVENWNADPVPHYEMIMVGFEEERIVS